MAVPQFTSEPFPLNATDDRMIIAPYWADTDIRLTGEVWYRETSESSLLARARREILIIVILTAVNITLRISVSTINSA